MDNPDTLAPIIDYDGQPISRTCIVRDMPITVYHSQCCALPSISSSGVRTIEAKSLEHFYDTSDLNPDRAEQEAKHHFSWGRALHHLAAGEADFSKHFAVRPLIWDSWRTKDAQGWRAEQVAAGLDVLVPEDLDTLRRAADKLAAHPTIQAGILSGLVEHSIFWRRDILVGDTVVKIILKSRPDVLPVEANMIVDLKSTADASPVAVRRAIGDYGYEIQLGMAHEGLLATLGRTMTDHVLVFIENKRPCSINIKPLSALAIEYGRRQLKRAVHKFAYAIANNHWAGYDDDEVECHLPDWKANRLSREAEAGLLPELDPPEEPAMAEAPSAEALFQ